MITFTNLKKYFRQRNNMKNLNLFLVIIIGGLFITGIILYSNLKNIESEFLASLVQLESLPQKEKGSSLNDFTKCLTEKGVKFYGASWDGHSQNQKIIFGEAAKYLPYIECIEPETNQMTFECQLAEIKAFPTWEFPNGQRKIGETSLSELENLSGCIFK